MKLVIQRVTQSSVKIDNQIVGEIGKGMMVLVGLTHDDTLEIVEKLATRLLKLRIFPDEHKPLNLNIHDFGGQILLVSQFTLYANLSKGNRPSFVDAMEPTKAEELFNTFVAKVTELHSDKVATGKFGADMAVELINDGPTTIILEA
ncbi:MAG: D-tyrosyl-tRNA(Tyr) deacylase [Alteromonas naphthalenivorans]|jgi:D-tyrosyl-tRNA(Tyr) deacylase